MQNNSPKPAPGRLGVIIRNVVALRAKPEDKSEQITQALIGQPVYAEGGQGDWIFVQTWDSYRGWVRADRVRMLDGRDTPYASTGPVAIMRELFVDIFTEPFERADVITKATISTEIEVARVTDEWVELRLPNGRLGFIRRHDAKLVDKDTAQAIWLPVPSKLAETAMRFVGIPYLWGGTSPFGIDCSGFVQLVYRIHNVTLLRDAHMQATDTRGTWISKNDLSTGDLMFFGKPKKTGPERFTHVGMVLDRERFIHSCGDSGVTITQLDDSYYSSIYCGAVRMRLETLDPGGGVPQD